MSFKEIFRNSFQDAQRQIIVKRAVRSQFGVIQQNETMQNLEFKAIDCELQKLPLVRDHLRQVYSRYY
jgi:hypothetical protein